MLPSVRNWYHFHDNASLMAITITCICRCVKAVAHVKFVPGISTTEYLCMVQPRTYLPLSTTHNSGWLNQNLEKTSTKNYSYHFGTHGKSMNDRMSE